MHFSGTDVFKVLTSKGVTTLHHANSVTTSCTFLHVKGLASRGFVEKNGLSQTAQPLSDDLDKGFGIWNDVFTDGVDVHYRGGRKRGGNDYGPVLFRLPVSVLTVLPPGSVVMVAKKNPYRWRNGEPESERYFQTLMELSLCASAGGYRMEDFGHHVIIRTPTGVLPFSVFPVTIDLDDPKRTLNGPDAFEAAAAKLQAAAEASGVDITISRHQCQTGCVCIANYARAPNFSTMF